MIISLILFVVLSFIFLPVICRFLIWIYDGIVGKWWQWQDDFMDRMGWKKL